jgi:two-component system response regulator
MNAGPILILEDDENDAYLLIRALHRNKIQDPVAVRPDGTAGVAHLSGEGPYADRNQFPWRSVLIVDIKMPKMTGLEFLEWLKGHPEFSVIPTLIFSSSDLAADVERAYKSGANSFLVMPGNFADLESLVNAISEYWQRCIVPKDRN